MAPLDAKTSRAPNLGNSLRRRRPPMAFLWLPRKNMASKAIILALKATRAISKVTVALGQPEAICLSQTPLPSPQAMDGHRKRLLQVHWRKSYVGNSHSKGDHHPSQVLILLHLPYQPFQKRAMSPTARSFQVHHHHHPLRHHLRRLCQA